MKIPQMFYLRQVKLKVGKSPSGNPIVVILFAYYNYRKSIKGVVEVPARITRNPREYAKQVICNANPEAEFWR